MAVVIVGQRELPDPSGEQPYPGLVRGFDASFGHRSDLITAKGGAELADELERPRRPLSGWLIVRRHIG